MKRDNKGFSMVELIIVIAIMAILVGIVGSQVLPYLNKSREAKDQQILSGWVTASTASYAMNAADLTDDSYNIVLLKNGSPKVSVASGTNKQLLEDSFISFSGVDVSDPFNVFSSKLYQQITKLTFTVTTESNGSRNAICICDIQGITEGTISTLELVAK